jgi:GNAT superfamily N-acetyltransferase
METIDVVPATAERWDAVVTVMGVRGDPSTCWCQFFRLRGRDWRAATPKANRAALHRQVAQADGPAPGVLAYSGDEPVGWCAVAPKASYPRVCASRTSAVADEDLHGVWSVTCFVVRVGYRRRGVAHALLRGAVDLAQRAGSTIVEGYPVDPAARSSVSAAELYHGTVSVFRDAGFVEVRRPSPARAVVQLALR